jgi:hypothetical protein
LPQSAISTPRHPARLRGIAGAEVAIFLILIAGTHGWIFGWNM